MKKSEADELLFQKQAALCDEIAMRLRECKDMDQVQQVAELLDMKNTFIKVGIREGEREVAKSVPVIRKKILNDVRLATRQKIVQFMLEQSDGLKTRGERVAVRELAKKVGEL